MKILIVKTSSLGDIIHVYPVISYIKNKFPEAIIDFVIEEPFAELALSHPFLRKVILINSKKCRKSISQALSEIQKLRNELKREKYDICFDLQCNIKSGLIVSQVMAAHKVGFGFKTAIEWPNCFFNRLRFDPPSACNVRDENLYIVKEYFKKFRPADEKFESDRLFEKSIKLKISIDEQKSIDQILLKQNSQLAKVMVCPGSIWKNKQISNEAMVSFLKRVHEQRPSHFSFIWGSPLEKAYCEELKANFPENSQILDKLNLSVLQNLMGQMDLVIAMDSLPLHLAGTTGVATFSFFGPSSASKFMPIGKNHQAFQGSCPYGRTITRRCPKIRSCKTGACLKNPSPDDLTEKLNNTLI